MDVPSSHLPPVLAEIAAVAGEAAALAMAAARGGTQVYIPPIPPPDHWLTELLGEETARAVAAGLTRGQNRGFRLDLPLGPSSHYAQQKAIMRETIRRMLNDGRSERDIALTTRYTIRTVRRHRAAMRDDRQLNLFD